MVHCSMKRKGDRALADPSGARAEPCLSRRSTFVGPVTSRVGKSFTVFEYRR